MNNDDMNRTLAEVEGINICPYNPVGIGTKLSGICTKCGKDYDTHVLPFAITDYPTNLEACMRVAEKLGVSVVFYKSGIVDLCRDRLTNVLIRSKVPGGITRAATLCPMLVEIAKERKG